MVDAVYRGNIEELLSVINYLKKYVIVFVIVLLVLLSVFHFSQYSVQVVPLITVTLVLLPAVYYTTVLVLKFGSCVFASNQTAEVAAMDADGGRGRDALKAPERPYPNSPTPPPSYEEATRNDQFHNHVHHQYRDHHQPLHYQTSPWLPSTSSGYTSGYATGVFDVEHQYRRGGHGSGAWAPPPPQTLTQTQTPDTQTPTPPPPPPVQTPQTPTQPPQPTTANATIKNIPSVTITMDNDHNGSMEI